VPYSGTAHHLVVSRAGVAMLLVACAADTPAPHAAVAGVLRNIAPFPDLLSALRDEGALPLLVQLVSLGTPQPQELVLGCLEYLASGDGAPLRSVVAAAASRDWRCRAGT
jgi:vacuolar protein 8